MNWSAVWLILSRITLFWLGMGALVLIFEMRLSAAQKHFVWVLVQAGALVIPLLFISLPPQTITPAKPLFAVEQSTVAVGVNAAQQSLPARRPVIRNLWPLLPWIWIVGAVGVLGWTAMGIARVCWVSRSAIRFATGQEFSGGIPVLISQKVFMPFTWGALHPAIVLPAAARYWGAAPLSLVLAHELAHIRRNDWATQMISRVVCAVYWFHPLAWLAASQLRKQGERACDDRALNQGASPVEYTQQLVDLVRLLGTRSLSMAVPMALQSDLEGRLRAILSPRANRKSVSKSRARLAALFAILVFICVAPSRTIAQRNGSVLAGAAHDPSGAAVPDVTITVSGVGHREITTTNDAGEYRFSGLEPGSYNLEAKKPGFAVFERTVVVQAGSEGQLPLDLQIGEVDETVEVEAKAPPPVPKPVGQPHRIRVGGSVEATKLITKLTPVYPESAQQRGVEGTVLLHAVIGIDGRLYSLGTLNTLVDPELAKAAMDAVSQWRYEPTLLNSEPVEVVTTITVNFKLAH